MPFRFDIDTIRHRTIVTGEGASNYDEIFAMVERMLADPAYESDAPILVDCRKLTYTASYQDALRYRDLIAGLKTRFRGPIAVVVTGAARFGVTRIVSSLLDLAGVHLFAFQTLEAAERWLEAPDAPEPHGT